MTLPTFNNVSSLGITGFKGSLAYDISKTPGSQSLLVAVGAGWTSVKSFVVDHPTDKNKYLVHGCLEGPEAGVYYRGKGEITNDEYTVIELPEYVDKLFTNITIQVTGIYDGFNVKKYNPGEFLDNKFTVYGPNGTFCWIIYGSRKNFEVEPLRENTLVKRNGPYTWIDNK